MQCTTERDLPAMDTPGFCLGSWWMGFGSLGFGGARHQGLWRGFGLGSCLQIFAWSSPASASYLFDSLQCRSCGACVTLRPLWLVLFSFETPPSRRFGGMDFVAIWGLAGTIVVCMGWTANVGVTWAGLPSWSSPTEGLWKNRGVAQCSCCEPLFSWMILFLE